MHESLQVALIGIGATAIVDLWSNLRRRLLGVPTPDFAHLGRWLAHLARGRFRHDPISASPAVAGERAIGWVAHYLIGVAFAALLVVVAGKGYLREPAIGPALAVGLGTVVFPFLLMQPGMGAGIAGSRTPRPAAVRIHSVTTHAVFGLGLYVTARALSYFTSA